MAQITLTIPDAHVTRVIEALCARSFPMPLAPGTLMPPEPLEPTAANAKEVVVEIVKAIVATYETQQARLAVPVVDTSGLVS